MNWLNNRVRPEILALKSYVSARSELEDTCGMLQMDANENPYTPYPQTAEMAQVNRYPQPQPVNLLTRLAAIYQVPVSQIYVGRGMDEGIELLIKVFCIPYRDNILITPPTFGYYRVAAEIAGIKVIEAPYQLEQTFYLDCQKLIAMATAETKIVFLCTPNNPTGHALSLTEIKSILHALPTTIIAVDEAYLEFSERPSACTLMEQYSNLVVLKTLSKAYAYAGVRLGSVLASSSIIKLLHKVMAPYPLAQPCVRLALQTLSPLGLQVAATRIAILKAERQRLFEQLSKLSNISVYPSEANFILIKVDDAQKTYQDMLARGIILRNRSHDIPNTLRISVGTPLENNLILAAFGLGNYGTSSLESQQHTSVRGALVHARGRKTDDRGRCRGTEDGIQKPLFLESQRPGTLVSGADYGVKKHLFLERSASIVRATTETQIIAEVNLDCTMPLQIKTGIGFFDHMLEQLAKHGGFSLNLTALGDTYIDYHHTVEDVAIVLGQALNQALGGKCGINRYGFVLPMDEAQASAVLDLSGRGILVYEAKYPTPMIGDFPAEMVEHFFLTLATHLQAAIHLKVSGANSHHMVEAIFKAFAKALNQAMGQTTTTIPSTKGVL
jgi:histidinol-phosphate aminotransferase